MISKYTWPNFRGGSDKDGCRRIIDEQGFAEDVQYGKTKVFIRSPQTIFSLEEARTEKIPGIVVFLQKVSCNHNNNTSAVRPVTAKQNLAQAQLPILARVKSGPRLASSTPQWYTPQW